MKQIFQIKLYWRYDDNDIIIIIKLYELEFCIRFHWT